MIICLRKGKGSDKVAEALKNSGISKNDPDTDFDKVELTIGGYIELEHVDSFEAGKEIAKDHLKEDKGYYKKDLFAEERDKAKKMAVKSGKLTTADFKKSLTLERPIYKAQLTMAKVVAFLKENPDPEDYELHEWAEKNGYNKHSVEEMVYQLATEHVQTMVKGD